MVIFFLVGLISGFFFIGCLFYKIKDRIGCNKMKFKPTTISDARAGGKLVRKSVYGCIRKGYLYQGYFYFKEEGKDKYYDTKILAKYCTDVK